MLSAHLKESFVLVGDSHIYYRRELEAEVSELRMKVETLEAK